MGDLKIVVEGQYVFIEQEVETNNMTAERKSQPVCRRRN
jgi:hypothetical protein